MEGTSATYLGRMVPKENFRAFIYAPNGDQKLVESWDEFEEHMQTGLWFATRQDSIEEFVVDEKPKRVRKPFKPDEPISLIEKSEKVKILESSMELVDEDRVPSEDKDLVFEVNDDGFLPKEKK